MESTEFVAQLASFSGVEQQVRANDRLDGILEVLSGGVGRGARRLGRPRGARAGQGRLRGRRRSRSGSPRSPTPTVRCSWCRTTSTRWWRGCRRPPTAGTVDLGRRGRARRHRSRTAATASRSRATRARRCSAPGRAGLRHRVRGPHRGRRAGAGGRRRRAGAARRGRRGPLTGRLQLGSSSSLAALSIAASALEPPRSGCTRLISRR